MIIQSHGSNGYLSLIYSLIAQTPSHWELLRGQGGANRARSEENPSMSMYEGPIYIVWTPSVRQLYRTEYDDDMHTVRTTSYCCSHS